MNKIRTLVAHNNIAVANIIAEIVKEEENIDVISVETDGQNTYNKILDLQPELVFIDYNLKEINGLKIMKLSKDRLNENMPIFNLIADNEISDNEMNEVLEKVGNKFNSFVNPFCKERITEILKDYIQSKKY